MWHIHQQIIRIVKRAIIKLFTIGFAGKSAQDFFTMLQKVGVTNIIDTRVNNASQLSGFTKGKDLQYFAAALVDIGYEHHLEFAPTKELLAMYRDKRITWHEYEVAYHQLLEDRKILDTTDVSMLDHCVLLCSEHEPDQCHRRLLAEYLQKENKAIEIIHLM